MTGIVVDRLIKTHGAYRVLDHVSFSVEAGEFVVLLGPSGCGKSTLLRLIAGLDLPDGGAIRLGGKDMTYAEPADRMISMVFQSYGLFPHLTVRDNILFGLQIRGIAKAEQALRLGRAVDILGLGPLLDRRPSQLSGGQQQRVALGRAVVADRPICLMDEPLSNLDAQLRTSVRREIADLQRALGLTMVYVTHDQIEAMTLADRIVLLRSGEVMQNGTPRDLFERPANAFAASFIGSPAMNLIKLTRDQATPAFEQAWPAAARLLHEHAQVTLGARPDAIAADGAAGIDARVVATEYIGGSSMVTCELLGQRILIENRSSAGPPEVGGTLTLSVPPGAEHLFDATSGRRLN